MSRERASNDCLRGTNGSWYRRVRVLHFGEFNILMERMTHQRISQDKSNC